MDPLTAALQLVTAIITAHTELVKGMSPEQRMQYAQIIIDDMRAWRDFLNFFVRRSDTAVPAAPIRRGATPADG